MSDKANAESKPKDIVRTSFVDHSGGEYAGPINESVIPDLSHTFENPKNVSPDQAISIQRTLGNQALLDMMGHAPSEAKQNEQSGDFAASFHLGGDVTNDTIQRKGGSSKKPSLSTGKKMYILPKKKYQKRKGFWGRLFSKDYTDETNTDQFTEITDVNVSSTDAGEYKGKLGDDTVKVKKEFTITDPTKTQKDIITKATPEANPALLSKHQGLFLKGKGQFYVYDTANNDYSDGPYSYKVALPIEDVTQDGEYIKGKVQNEKIRVHKDNTTRAEWKKVASSQPLFGKDEPNENDVLQGGIGDCYLMAALSSLAKQQPNVIKENMVDQGDTVSVRFYKVDQSDRNNHTFKPKYVTVDKSVAAIEGKELYNKGKLWVSIMEKAYAAAGFSGGGDKKATDPTQMENISGGFSVFAFEALTGKKATANKLQEGPTLTSNNKYGTTAYGGWDENTWGDTTTAVGLPWDKNTINQIKQVLNGPKPVNYNAIGIYETVFDKKYKLLDEWYAYIKNSPNPVEKMFKDQKKERKDSYATQITIQDFERLFKKTNLNSAAGKKIIQYIRANKLYPGELSDKTAEYSQAQLDSFEAIKKALSDGKAVALSTYKYPAKVSQGTGHSGGESKADGIVGGHAYSVLGAKEDSNITGDGDGLFKVIQVRNPWGAYGRQYDFSETLPEKAGKAVEDGDGSFWLELRDLTKYFRRFDISG